MIRRLWFFFFLVSGFCALLYEVVWLRLAMAGFGVTTALVSIVLSVFMAGLAIGSWGAGALARRLGARSAATALRLYAAAEGITALSATAVPALLLWGRSVLTRAGGDWASAPYYAASAVFVVIALLPFCVCMGATYPLALSVLSRTGERDQGRHFSYLYVANVVGATLGALVSAFVLIERLGFRGTLSLAAFLNATLAASALLISVRLRPSEPPANGAGESASGAAAPAPSPGPVLLALFATGLVSMGMEVVWVREFTPYLGNLVYSFASILALYLCATFVGSMLYRRRAAAGAPLTFSAGLWSALFVLSLLPLAAADPRFGIYEADFAAGLVRVACGIVAFCATLGYLTPMLLDRFSGGEPRRAGRGYALNILGCILGPLLAGFGLLPFVGERGALVVLSLPLLAGAIALSLRSPGGRRAVLLAGVAVVALVLMTRDFVTAFPGAWVRRDATATVVATGTGKERQLLVNGEGMTALTPITKMMVHLPLAFRAQPPREVLVICFGMGTTYRSALTWGAHVTAVELVPSVADVVGYFQPDGDALRHAANGQIVIDDGRRFLERSTLRFDAVVVDPPPPVEAAGSSLLYSREFYESARRAMREDAILQQWIPGGEPLVVSAFVKAARSVFPHVRVFRSIEDWGVHVLASEKPIERLTAEALAARLPAAAARDLVEWGPWPTPEQQLGAVLAREMPTRQVAGLVPAAPVLVDDRPLNEYYFLRRQWRVQRTLY